ncbi:heterokaryon incompatibility protein-domain-containing protein [Suillus lakei]|nr:heterokaryon incompatibility protein-domain-containing protein [Suillus lakei]
MSWLPPPSLESFDRYVMNDILIHLIHLSDMKFVGRRDWNYHPSQTVKYAILSHRWLDEGEPTYEEMKNDTAAGPRYEKLKKFCEKAKEYEVEFVWSDTCCIDKSSSTELDDSIRSMFRWYRNSTICIVHLAQSDKIKFLNKHWMPLTDDRNDKSRESIDIPGILQRATGIPHEDLHEFYPNVYHRVDERMTWAARRTTTRVKDVAYSLMGIFDVSMQIAYGEGGERAFSRLMEAITRAGDPSVFNWKSPAASHHTSRAIPQSPQSFLGHPNLGVAYYT